MNKSNSLFVSKRGFTILEFIAVMAIISFFLMAATPDYIKHAISGQEKSYSSNVELVENGVDMTKTRTGQYPFGDGVFVDELRDYASRGLVYDLNGKVASANIPDMSISSVNFSIMPDYEPVAGGGYYYMRADGKVYFSKESLTANKIDGNMVDCDISKVYEYSSSILGTSEDTFIRDIPFVGNELYQTYDYTYGIDSYGNVSIVEYSGESDVVTIPGVIDGKPVTGIVSNNGVGAFEGKEITKIVIPCTIEFIDASSFNNNLLTKVEIPLNVEYIGENAFKNNSMTDVELSLGTSYVLDSVNGSFDDTVNLSGGIPVIN